MKKFLLVLLAFALMLPVCANAEQVKELTLNYEVTPVDYVGTWNLSAAYEIDNGILEVPADACTVVIETELLENKLVDMANYLHADVHNLRGTMSFNLEGVKVEPYECVSYWDSFTTAKPIKEGECEVKGANKFKIRDDDQGVFFDVITGIVVEDIELMEFIGINEDGQLVIGYSDENPRRDPEAEWLYAYLFTKAE